MKRRVFSLMLILSFLLAACGETESETVVTTAGSTDSSSAVETEFSYDPDLPDVDYDGYEFTFAVRGDDSGSDAWHSTDIVADELNGETLNDAIYQRTSYIEEKYNVHFNLMWCGETSVGLTGSAISSSGAILPIWS